MAGPISSVVLFLGVFSAWSGLVWLVGWSPGVLPAAARLATLAAFLSLIPLASVVVFQPLSFAQRVCAPLWLFTPVTTQRGGGDQIEVSKIQSSTLEFTELSSFLAKTRQNLKVP